MNIINWIIFYGINCYFPVFFSVMNTTRQDNLKPSLCAVFIFLWNQDAENKKETSYNQFFAILDKYIRANPQFWYQGLFTLINSAFNETEFFRCSKEDYK